MNVTLAVSTQNKYIHGHFWKKRSRHFEVELICGVNVRKKRRDIEIVFNHHVLAADIKVAAHTPDLYLNTS